MRTVALLCGSYVSSLIITLISFKLAYRFKWVSPSDPNTKPTALGGGIGVITAILVFTVYLSVHGIIPYRIPVGILPVFFVGLFDDLFRFSPPRKIVLECGAAAIYISFIPFNFPAILILFIFLISSQNAWNLIDVMDGLLGWIATICFLGVASVFYLYDPSSNSFYLLALISSGAILGFLIWNSYPAKVFMGDAGSLSVGMLFGIFVIEAIQLDFRLGLSLLICGLIPFFEMGFLMIERSRKGIPFYISTPDHFSMRMQRNGLAIPAVIRRIRYVSIILAICACLITAFGFNYAICFVMILLIAITGMAAYLYLRNLPN